MKKEEDQTAELPPPGVLLRQQTNQGEKEHLPERCGVQSIIPQTKMAACSSGAFVLLNHLLLCCANNLMCIWPLALLAPGGRFKLFLAVVVGLIAEPHGSLAGDGD